MRKLIKNKQIIEDSWQHLDQAEPLRPGDITLPLSRWLAEREQCQQHAGRVGIRLHGSDNVRELRGVDLSQVPLIAITFPKFADGRGYSQARILRDELKYTEELRAVGDVLRDQIFFLARCGFDAFEVRADKDLEEALAGLSDFSVTYQAASDDNRPIYRR